MTRVLCSTVAVIALLLGCNGGIGARSRQPKDPEAKLQEKLSFVQAVACLGPATEKACDPALSATFASPEDRSYAREPLPPGVSVTSSRIPAAPRARGTLSCEGGRPHVRVTTEKGNVDGEFGQVVWEAIWRVLRATNTCASAYGEPIVVIREGQSKRCDDPRFDMHSLLDMAIVLARRGPPAKAPKSPSQSEVLCKLDPSSCINTQTMCPLFLGDVWNGVTAAPPAGGAPGEETAPPETEATGTLMDMPSRDPLPQRPSQGEVSRVFSPLLDDAHRCLKVRDQVAKVGVVFQSSGAVLRVDVTSSGGAAPGCLERALGRARLSPFSDATYTVGLTIRSRE